MAATGPSMRSEGIDRILAELASLKGVTASAIVDSDGFVSHIRRDFEIDTDALGAAVQIMFGAATQAGRNVGHKDTALVLSESGNGMVLLAPLVRGFVLALVCDKSAMLGAVRFEVKDTIPLLNRVFSADR